MYDAARITVYGASQRIGRPEKQLTDAWDLRVEDRGADSNESARLFSAYLPTLGDAAPHLFDQPALFGERFNRDDTVLDWLGDATTAVWEDRKDSLHLDADLLNHFSRFRLARQKGLEDAAIQTRRYHRAPLHVNEELGLRAEALVAETPTPQRTRIKGALNTIAYLDRGLMLILDGGSKLRILWAPQDLEPLRGFWGKQVVVEGFLQFKPNGKPQILIADAIREAEKRDEVWSQLPLGLHSQKNARFLIPDVIDNPLKKLVGVLDGDVSDEEFQRMLEEAS